MSDEKNKPNFLLNLKQGGTVDPVKLVASRPYAAAIASKLVTSRDEILGSKARRRQATTAEAGQLDKVTKDLIYHTEDNENIQLMFPDIKLAQQIVVSSIVSPKDMVQPHLNYDCRKKEIPAQIRIGLLDTTKRHFEDGYFILDRLYKVVDETLFQSGAYVRITIPESIVDQIIHGNTEITTESIDKLKEHFVDPNTGLMGGYFENEPGRIAAESATGIDPSKPEPFIYKNKDSAYASCKYIDFTDNYEIIKVPALQGKFKKLKTRSIIKKRAARLSAATEAEKLSDDRIQSLLFSGRQTVTKDFHEIPNSNDAKRRSIGRALSMHWPTTSIIPIYSPGDPTNHIGYIGIVDQNGYPISSNDQTLRTQQLTSMLSNETGMQGNDLGHFLIDRAKNTLHGKGSMNQQLEVVTRLFSTMLEENIVRRLKNGINEDSFKLSENQDIYQLMMARTFSNQYTRIVYIPEEFVTYYANDYHKNGIGKSITYGLTYLSSLRAMTRLAKVTGMLKTAIPITRVNVTFAEDDPDPHATAEMIAHDVLRYKAPPLPIGNNSPQMLADFLVRSGIEFNFEGSERFPGTKIEFETKSLQHSTPDDSTDDDMRKQQYMAMGVSPEMVDNGFSPEHATTVTKNHLLLSRRVITHQNKFEPSLAQEGRKSLQFDSLFLEEAHRVIEDNKGLLEKYLSDDQKTELGTNKKEIYDQVIEEFLDNLVITFPKPDDAANAQIYESFDNEKKYVTDAIEFWFSNTVIPNDVSGEINNNADTIKSMLIAYHMREWMTKNNFMMDLGDVVKTTEDDKPMLDIYEMTTQHTKGVMRSIIKLLRALRPAKNAANTDLTNMDTEPGEASSASSSSDSGSDDGGSEDDQGGGDDFGMGDFGMEPDGFGDTEEEETPEGQVGTDGDGGQVTP